MDKYSLQNHKIKNEMISVFFQKSCIKFTLYPFVLCINNVFHNKEFVFGEETAPFSYKLDIESRNRVHRNETALSQHPDNVYYPKKVLSYVSTKNKLLLRLVGDDPFENICMLEITESEDANLEVLFSLKNATYVTEISTIYHHENIANEVLWGGGERFDSITLNGRKIKIQVEEGGGGIRTWSYCPIPIFLSSYGYGVVVKSYYLLEFDFRNTIRTAKKQHNISIISFSSSLQFTLLVEKSPQILLKKICRLTSFPALPPKWLFGNIRNINGGESEILKEAIKLRENKIPCTGIWYYDSLDENRHIGWPINTNYFDNNYPDISKLNNILHNQRFKVQTYFFPYFYEGTSNYAECESQGLFIKNNSGQPYRILHCGVERKTKTTTLKPAALLDFTNPNSVKWLGSIIKQIVEDLNFDGWMQDFGEDAPIDGVYYDQNSGRLNSNKYPYLYHKTVYELASASKPEIGFFARSGSLGSNKYVPMMWTGDQTCSWDEKEGIATVLSAVISLGFSGYPMVGPDIAGFFNYAARPGEPDEELWIRWLQLCSLFPVMRDLHAFSHIDIWSSVLTIRMYSLYARLHIRLFPHFYYYATEANLTGVPIIRHLFLNYSDDTKLKLVEDQFMIGMEILVAPVLTKQAKSREIVFPEGDWIDWWDEKKIHGASIKTLPVNIELIPIFIKNRSCILMLSDSVETLYSEKEILGNLEMHLYNYNYNSTVQGKDIFIEDRIISGNLYSSIKYSWNVPLETIKIFGLDDEFITIISHSDKGILRIKINGDGCYEIK